MCRRIAGVADGWRGTGSKRGDVVRRCRRRNFFYDKPARTVSPPSKATRYSDSFALSTKRIATSCNGAAFKFQICLASVTTGKFANSNGNLFGRRAFIEVQNDSYGRFRAGLQFSPFVIAVIRSDPRSSSPYETSFTGSIAVPYVQLIRLNGLFDSNAITYLTPTIAGLDAQIEYAPGGVAGSLNAGRRLSGALNYNRYGISADVAYYEARDPVISDVTTRAWTAGAGYTIGPATFRAAFTNFRNPSKDTALSNVSVYSIGGRASLNPFWVVSGGVYASFDRNIKSNKSLLFGAAVEYYLSIRTSLYAQVAVVHNNGNMGTGLAVNSGVGGLTAGTATGIGVGLRHFF